MTFQEAERTYKDLKAQHASGKLSDADFEAQVGKLKLQDAQQRWWQIGVQTGDWYMHDGQKWNKAKPPLEAPPVVAPPPPVSEATPTPVDQATTMPLTPAPGNGEKKAGRASVPPTRLFSSKPAGREGGLPMPMLIGIIAGVAVVVILIAVGAMWALGVFNPTASGARTPTRVALGSPTAVIVAPTVRPTDPPTPLPTPTIIAAPTITPTLATTATATRRPGTTPVTKATAVPTKAGVAASPTPNVPPGLYVTKLETIPPKIGIGGTDKIQVGFKATFFNNSGGMQSFKKWYVRVFQCPEQCVGDRAFRNSYGESLKQDVNIATGATVEITTPAHVTFGPGRCEYVAVPYYTGDNEIPVPFNKIGGGGLYYSFSVCN